MPDPIPATEQSRALERRDWLNAMKCKQGCIDCGTKEGRLDFDHRPGTVKLFQVSNGTSRAQILAEIAKCDVRCVRCHAKRHHPTVGGPCSVDGCDKLVEARGWCHTHYIRFRRTGSPVGHGGRSRATDGER